MDNPRKLIEEEIPRLRRYALCLTCNADDADDLVQDAVARALDRLHLWQSGTSMRAWLFTITRNLFINDVRRERWRVNRLLEFTLNAGEGVPASQECGIYSGEVLAAFLGLSDDHREVLMLIAVEALTYEEAAQVIDVPPGTVRSRLWRARNALHELMERKDKGHQA